MSELPANEYMIRLAFFVGIFIIIALLELVAPRRQLTTSKKARWFSNIGIVIIDTVILRLIIPAGLAGVSVWIGKHGWGILNLLGWPFAVNVIISIILLDYVIYLQHLMFHAVPLFWRLHMMHHTDLDFDLTTGFRFHPMEILLSAFIKACAISILGAAAIGVIIFEVLLNATSVFNHGNFKLPLKFDTILRLLVVTPDMHRVHHSVFPTETNSNFGFNLPWWDRAMGTYKAQPRLGHLEMTIGLNQFRNPAALSLPRLLVLPFTGKTGSYPLGRRGT